MTKTTNVSVEICKVDKDTKMADCLLEFVENFSWEEVKEHTVRVIRIGSMMNGKLLLWL